MATKKDVKKYMLDHSYEKVTLLGNYLKRYLNIIARDGYTEQIEIYDLFCGRGKYNNGGKGSPLVILEKVKSLIANNRKQSVCSPKFLIVFNDIDSENTDNLKSIIPGYLLNSPNINIIFRNKHFKDTIEPLSKRFSKFKNRKAFVFIDPYGYKEIQAASLKLLLQTKKSELLLFLPVQFMHRFKDASTPPVLKQLLEDLSVQSENATSTLQFIDQLKEGFRSFLGAKYFVDTFTLERDMNSVFCLFFFSSHIRGFEKMLEAKWESDEAQGRGFKLETSGDLFSEQLPHEFTDKLSRFLETARSNGEIYQFTLKSGYLAKHATRVLRTFQNENKLQVTVREGIRARKSAFYISYDNFKNTPDKIQIKMI